MVAPVRIGTSGWSYPGWRGKFYPRGLPANRWLAHYATVFDTIELNASFYRLPSPEQFARWAAQVPDGFLFTVKASRQPQGELLEMGSTFGMDMRLGVPYRIANEVVEFEPDRRLAWRHMGGHRWRYEITPDGDSACTVTETFDWSTSKLPLLIQALGQDRKHVPNMTRTLERLDRYVTTGSPD